MKLLNLNILKLTFYLALGILIAHYSAISLNTSLTLTISLLLCTVLTLHLVKLKRIDSIYFGLAAFVSMVSIGILTTNLNNQKLSSKHYTNHNSEGETITFRIKSALKPNSYYHKYIIELLKVEDYSVSGQALLNIKKDSTSTALKTDAIYLTTESLLEIKSSLNPNQFDYKNYLEKQYIYHQIHTNQKDLFLIKKTKHTLFGYSDLLRENIITKLQSYNFSSDALSVINALLLGQRQDISKEVYSSYAKAGVIHILAVSGLHIGIILMLLNYTLSPLNYIKYGKTVKIILILALLWSFAVIAGLSASVTRAVTMFSIIAIGMNLKRPTNIYNTITISIFILLLFKPLFLFDVGFQLSYMAVLSIVAIQPIISKQWNPRFWVTKKIWDIFTVTLAAQLGVLPISLFYFHQFPSLFFLSNLIIIPFLGIILGFGFLIIVLALLNGLPEVIATIYGETINSMNGFVLWISKQEAFFFQDISYNFLQVITSYLLIIALVRLYVNRNLKWVGYTLTSILLFQGTFIYTKHNTNTKGFTIFHKNRHTVITNKSNMSLRIDSNLDSLNTFKALTNYKVANNIKEIQLEPLNHIYKINDEILLVIDSVEVYRVKSFKPDYILLSNSPKINLKRMIDSILPKQIIADGSNYKSYINRWKTTCKKQKIPFHYTGEMGAFIINTK